MSYYTYIYIINCFSHQIRMQFQTTKTTQHFPHGIIKKKWPQMSKSIVLIAALCPNDNMLWWLLAVTSFLVFLCDGQFGEFQSYPRCICWHCSAIVTRQQHMNAGIFLKEKNPCHHAAYSGTFFPKTWRTQKHVYAQEHMHLCVVMTVSNMRSLLLALSLNPSCMLC